MREYRRWKDQPKRVDFTKGVPDVSALPRSEQLQVLRDYRAWCDAQVKPASPPPQIAAGGAVYVHCNGGKGRSAVCVLAYLVRSQKLTAHEAYAQVAAQRKIARLLERPLGIPRPQWRALRLYEESVRVEGDLAGAAAAMEEGVGADTALPPPRAKIKATQVAPL